MMRDMPLEIMLIPINKPINQMELLGHFVPIITARVRVNIPWANIQPQLGDRERSLKDKISSKIPSNNKKTTQNNRQRCQSLDGVKQQNEPSP